MRKYLIKIQVDVADEGDVGLIKVVNEKQLLSYNSVYTGFGNIEGETYYFDDVAEVTEISEEEFELLKRLELVNVRFGYCDMSTDELDEHDDIWD